MLQGAAKSDATPQITSGVASLLAALLVVNAQRI